MKWTLIIGMMGLLALCVGAVDLYVDQATVDSYNFSTFTPQTLLCDVLGNDPYIYVVGNELHTYYTCLDIEPHNDTHYHVYDGIYNTAVSVDYALLVWDATNHNLTTTTEWYWNTTGDQFIVSWDALLDRYKSFQTPNSTFYEGWGGGQLW